jgi:hypothetical protein
MGGPSFSNEARRLVGNGSVEFSEAANLQNRVALLVCDKQITR